MKELLGVSNKGNCLLVVLNLVNVVLLLVFSMHIQLKSVNLLQSKSYEIEKLKIQAIRRVKDEFYNQKCEDFELHEGSSSVSVMYDELECRLVFSGQKDFTILITYDDVFLCIGSVEYD